MNNIKIYKPYKVKNRNLYCARLVTAERTFYVYGDTKVICNEKLLEKQQELRTHIICTGVTVAEFSNIWIEQRVESLSPTTKAEWKRLVNKWIVPALGNYRLAELRCSHCQQLITEYNKEHSAKSCKALRGVLHTMLEYARMNELILTNPCEHINIAPSPAYEYYIYTEAEMKKLLHAIKGERDFEIPIVLASHCGLRASEIFGLRWEDIDFEERKIQVRQVAVYAEGKRTVKNVPKTATSAKPIIVPASVIEMLKRYRNEATHPLVVCDDDGSPFVSANYHKRFDNLLLRLGMPKTRFHDLRHFVATSLMDAGLPDKVITEYLRHADTNITKKYQHIRESAKTTASDVIADLLA